MKKNIKSIDNITDSLFKLAKNCLEKKQYKKAYELLKEAAPSGDLFVLSELKHTYLYHISPRLEDKQLCANLEKKAKNDDVCSAIKLAEKYIEKALYKKAFNLLLKFEKINNPKLLYLLADCYCYGYGTKENNELSFQYYLRSAIGGYPAAQYKLGLIYYAGELNTPKDEVEGLKWLLTANDQGYPVFALLAHSHENASLNISKDDYKKLYKHVSNEVNLKGVIDYYLLGLIYDNGYGVKINKENANKYFAVSAKQNHPVALAHLSEYYLEKKNYKKAFEYAKESSSKGCPLGDVLLGDCYFYGYHVKQDYDQAFAYYKKAYDVGSQFAQLRFDVHRMY